MKKKELINAISTTAKLTKNVKIGFIDGSIATLEAARYDLIAIMNKATQIK
ncbi:MAG: hypothetical protein NTZ86_09170 [Legionellales bacterium]|nr:hypothetical protein [Legionellales bacterium]